MISKDLFMIFLDSAYKSMLRRSPDDGSIDYYYAQYIHKNRSLTSIFWEIKSSNEYSMLKPNMLGNFMKEYLGPPIFFLHLEKCAGSSIINFFSDILAPWQIYQEGISASFDAKSHKFASGHQHLQFVQNYAETPILITCLRSPTERLISLFNYHKYSDFADTPLAKFIKDMTFSEWIHCDDEVVLSAIDNLYARRVCSDIAINLKIYNLSDIEKYNFFEESVLQYDNFKIVADFSQIQDFNKKLNDLFCDNSDVQVSWDNKSPQSSTLPEISESDLIRIKSLTHIDWLIYNKYFLK
jgi:hypothetical protein